jgi:carbonic anhydrase
MANGRNTLGAVAVIHHTDCGLINFDKKYLDQKLRERVGDNPELLNEIEHMNHYDFNEWVLHTLESLGRRIVADSTRSVERSVREDMAIIKADPYLPKDLEVLGFVHDSFSGRTNELIWCSIEHNDISKCSLICLVVMNFGCSISMREWLHCGRSIKHP